ncbi:multidrug effflux MFS transporter [Sulfitobacter sp. F26169L]|nr:multidrug effflux MFS transporter [Sulfitobacter sp. F26169L]MCX7565396.1 multidrug effflux MFS transporter [Sulfitobacter sp. F26169L]
MGRTEFVALMAMMLASVAFSIDAMLPALPQIAAELSPDAPNKAPLILSMFLFGMGAGTFFTGPLSDAFGRKRVVLAASALFIFGAGLAWASQSLELVLFARVLQGLGAAGPRVVSIAVVRDRFSGRQMAQIVSVVMMIFTIVPAVAPMLGSFIIDWSSWRGIFIAFILFAMIFSIWMMVRLPETLPVENRRPLRLKLLFAAMREMALHPVVRLSIIAQMLVSAMLFLTLMLVQQVYDQVYDRGEEFPYWFFVVAVIAGSASLINALLVVRFGMHRLISWALGFQIFLSGAYILFDLGGGTYGFYFFVFWQMYIFFQAGLTIGNLNALAMEPMGHIAGMAASVMGAIATVGAVAISGPIGTMFSGDERLLTTSVLVLASVAFACMWRMARAMHRDAIG